MVKLVVLYGKPEDPGAFDAHYAGTHAGLAERIPGLQRFEHGKVLGTPDGSEPPYYYLAELSFDDADTLQAGLGSAEGQAAVDDLATFASGGVTIVSAAA